MNSQRQTTSLRPEEREIQQQRVLKRERRRTIGLLVIALIILALAFLRFGKTIPWGAR